MHDAHDVITELTREDYERAVRARADFEKTQLAEALAREKLRDQEEKKRQEEIDLWISNNSRLLGQYKRAYAAEDRAREKMNKEPSVIKYRKACSRRRKIAKQIPAWVKYARQI